MEETYVSVIIATFNRKQMLEELLESLAGQSYRYYEVIVVDDGSTDGTWDWLEANRQRLPYLLRTYRSLASHGGPAAPRNLAMREAKGDIIAFTDSDCVVPPEWLARGLAYFRSVTGFVQGRTIPHPGDPRPMFFTTGMVDAATGDTSNIFYRRAVLDKVGGFSSDFMGGPSKYSMYGDDIDLAYRVKEAGFEGEFASDALAMHHVGRQSLRHGLLRPLPAMTGPHL